MRFGIISAPRNMQAEIDNARLADEVGFSMVGSGDSQSIVREVYVMMALISQVTKHVMIGPTVSNGITRHPAVTASGIASVDEASGGRAFLGLGTGDSAILNLGERPMKLAELRRYIETVRRC